MNAGILFDWMGRIFGIAFLLFILSVLIFPNWRETGDVADELPWDWYEQARANGGTEQSESTPQSRQEQAHGKVLSFSRHRRAHQ